MNPQGSLPFNPKTFERLIQQAETIETCEQLQALASEAMASANAVTSAITEQLAAVQPILALLTAPGANPAQIVTWISDFITVFLKPYAKPAITLPIQLAQVAAQVAQLTAAINAAANRIGNCSVDIGP